MPKLLQSAHSLLLMTYFRFKVRLPTSSETYVVVVRIRDWRGDSRDTPALTFRSVVELAAVLAPLFVVGAFLVRRFVVGAAGTEGGTGGGELILARFFLVSERSLREDKEDSGISTRGRSSSDGSMSLAREGL